MRHSKIALILILICAPAMADIKSIVSTGGSMFIAIDKNGNEISQHTKQEKAEFAVIDHLQKNCIELCTGYVRRALEIRIVSEPNSPIVITEPIVTILSWGIPTTREDGTALDLIEISHYEVIFNGISIHDEPSNSWIVPEGTPAGTEATVKTVLKDGQKSVESKTVIL